MTYCERRKCDEIKELFVRFKSKKYIFSFEFVKKFVKHKIMSNVNSSRVVFFQIFFHRLGFRKTVDKESSKKLEIGSLSVAVLPAFRHEFVDFVGAVFRLRQALTFLDQLVDLWVEN